ncbi:hypothetical protein [Nocardia sp. BMG51109]|uniref:hypothetical protein n=1 Tax=Nocardia sp. BMG51109 TaxID=1056816 RepID=UPI0004657B4C|nr:hypothetical protein [Nocardia sp. BMG51109]
MTILTLPGEITSAFTHFALYGLAALCEDAGTAGRLWWARSRTPKPCLDVGDLAEQDVAELVHRHSLEHCLEDSWIQQRTDHENRSTAVFSPRIKAASNARSWCDLQEARHTALDQLSPADELDLRMIGGLGEPAWWRAEPDPRPDDGASRWEMKTRNRGEEFVGNRLQLLAAVVAARTPGQVLDGLLGNTVTDEVGGGSESRTATGLRRPGTTDNALAWCALWGITQFPTIHHVDGLSTTPGAFVRAGRTTPTSMHLPVFTDPVTLARTRTVLLSSALATVGKPTARDNHSNDEAAIRIATAQSWLSNRIIRAVVRFPVHVSNNPSAPERQVLDGEIIVLPQPE